MKSIFLSRRENKRQICFWNILFLIAMLLLILGCQYCNRIIGVSDDWAGEEIAEELIKAKTGLELDLTPESKE